VAIEENNINKLKIAKPAPVAIEENNINKLKIAQQANEKAKARADLLDLEKEKQDKIDTVVKATAKVREDALNKTLTLEEQILAARDKVNKSEQAAVKSKAGIESANAEFILAQDRANLQNLLIDKKKQEQEINDQLLSFFDDINKAAQDAADKEKLKTAELEKQTGELRKQIKVKQDDINNSRRQAELPTMADVISGKRNIGDFGKSSASKLEKARAKALELSDAEQRAREAYAGATTGGAKDAALAQGRGIRARLDQTRGQIGSMEKLLGSRVSDANPYAAMEKELALVKDELVTLNTKTLASTSAK
jgi:hypothetical protein